MVPAQMKNWMRQDLRKFLTKTSMKVRKPKFRKLMLPMKQNFPKLKKVKVRNHQPLFKNTLQV